MQAVLSSKVNIGKYIKSLPNAILTILINDMCNITHPVCA